MQFLALLLSSIHYKTDYFFLQWLIGFTVSCLPIFFYIKKEISLPIALLFYYLSFYLFFECFSDLSLYAHSKLNTSLSLSMCVNYLSILFPAAAILFLPKEKLRSPIQFLPVYAIINSLYVITGYLFKFGRWAPGHGYSGFIDYASANGSLIAITMLPLFLKLSKKTIPLILLCLIAIFFSFSSIPYGVFATGIFGLLICNRPKLIPLCLLPIAFGAAVDKHLFDSGHRLEAYNVFMTSWSKDNWSTIFFGTGPGSFQVVSGTIQKAAGFMQNDDGSMWQWIRMHSDWLQTLFEWGIVGFLLAATIFLQALYRLYLNGEKEVFAMLLAIGAYAVFDYPARHFILAILIMYCIIYAARFGDRDIEKKVFGAIKSGLSSIKTG